MPISSRVFLTWLDMERGFSLPGKDLCCVFVSIPFVFLSLSFNNTDPTVAAPVAATNLTVFFSALMMPFLTIFSLAFKKIMQRHFNEGHFKTFLATASKAINKTNNWGFFFFFFSKSYSLMTFSLKIANQLLSKWLQIHTWSSQLQMSNVNGN